MKVVIYTQHKENYGAHDWDGKGECPQYWKFKGGNTYVVHGVSVAQGQDAQWWDALYAAIESRSESFEEYIISADLVDECDYDASKVCESWEAPINLEFKDGNFYASCYKKSDFVWEGGVVAKLEQWIQIAGRREDYVLKYELENGDLITYAEWQSQAAA